MEIGVLSTMLNVIVITIVSYAIKRDRMLIYSVALKQGS